MTRRAPSDSCPHSTFLPRRSSTQTAREISFTAPTCIPISLSTIRHGNNISSLRGPHRHSQFSTSATKRAYRRSRRSTKLRRSSDCVRRVRSSLALCPKPGATRRSPGPSLCAGKNQDGSRRDLHSGARRHGNCCRLDRRGVHGFVPDAASRNGGQGNVYFVGVGIEHHVERRLFLLAPRKHVGQEMAVRKFPVLFGHFLSVGSQPEDVV